MTTFFTSDTHFGHKMLVERAHRPFLSVETMNEQLLRNWNCRVGADDEVYHLGDFAWRDAKLYLEQLNGTKHLIVGNHDHSKTRSLPGWASVRDNLELKVDGLAAPIVLHHYAKRVWNRSHYGALHFYGHSHASLPGDSQSLDVGVDNPWTCWGPVTLEQILAQLARNPPHRIPDHHRPSAVSKSKGDPDEKEDT